MPRDYYEILGVARDADEDAMKKSYRKLAMQYHPDRNPGDKAAEDKFKEAAEAYSVLSDKTKRAQYDRFGHAGVSGPGGGGPGGHGGMSMDDIFSNFGDFFGGGGGGGENPFESFFGGGGRRGGGGARPQGQRGTNLRIKVKMTLEEIATGINKKIKVKKQVTCHNCAGSGAKDRNSVSTCGTCKGSGYVRQVRSTFLGQMQTTAACPTCSGSGQQVTAACATCKGAGNTYGEDTIDIDIPAGVADGMQLSASGRGNAGAKGGAPGDLLITIEEITHEHFQREGNNILHECFVNFAEAVLGTSVEVPTLTGRVKVKLPPGTPSGKIFRLQGKGLPGLQSYEIGDQLVHINVWIPTKLNDEERRLLEKLQTMPNFNPQADAKADKGFFDKIRDVFA
ncbi:MAG: molecular chaperone DnaJ [Bacteroidota bacterium]|jgi:molecular chaperone DnaJ